MKIKDFFVVGMIKRLLDLLPFNDYKTFIGIAITVLGIVLQLVNPATSVGMIIAKIIEILKQIDAGTLVTTGVTIAGVGLVHKGAKSYAKREGFPK